MFVDKIVTELIQEDLGKLAFEIYHKELTDIVPSWEEQNSKVQQAWIAVAEAVRDKVHG